MEILKKLSEIKDKNEREIFIKNLSETDKEIFHKEIIECNDIIINTIINIYEFLKPLIIKAIEEYNNENA